MDEPEVMLFARRNGAELGCPVEGKHLTDEGRKIVSALRLAVNQACETLNQTESA